MIISHKYKFIFIKTQKTAGTSIELFLAGCRGKLDVFTPIHPAVEGHSAQNHAGYFNPISEFFIGPGRAVRMKTVSVECISRKKFYNHMPAWKVRARVPAEIWNTYFKFCVERNPWDKVISAYYMAQYRSEQELTFDKFVSAGLPCHNYHLYTELGKSNELLVDHVVKYENLDGELKVIFERLGVPFDGALTETAKGSYRQDRTPYQDIYTAAQTEIIRQEFLDEIALLGYEF